MTGKRAALFLVFSIFFTVILFSFNTVTADQGVYAQKCSKCHSLRKPEIYTKKQWEHHVKRMADRAGLTSGEIQSIIKLHPN